MSVSPVIRRRLETQGFVGLDDAALAEVESWLRLSPAGRIPERIGLYHTWARGQSTLILRKEKNHGSYH
jgi:hypothetical protein